MKTKNLQQLIAQTEIHIECWKQFNYFVGIARGKKFGPEDETRFLELKSIIIQDLELIFSSIEVAAPSKEDILTLIGHAPSLRYLSEMGEGDLRAIENHWHKIYIDWHSILGQIKVQQRARESKSLFGWKK
ncbi:MAG: hypothetical protein ABSG87_09035 [Verrucomicrobiota bacterium]|jgi:hypothetical protein